MSDKPFTKEQVAVIGTIVAVRIDAALQEMQESARHQMNHYHDIHGFTDEARNIALEAIADTIDWMD